MVNRCDASTRCPTARRLAARRALAEARDQAGDYALGLGLAAGVLLCVVALVLA